MCRILYKNKGANIQCRVPWLCFLLKLLMDPLSYDCMLDLIDRCNANLLDSLLDQLVGQGFVYKFCAVDNNIARYYAYNRRLSCEEFVRVDGTEDKIKNLSAPKFGKMSFELALKNRYSFSEATSMGLTSENMSILLEMTYGFFKSSDSIQRRVVPSAGGLYPLEIFLALPCNEGLESFVYDPVVSQLTRVSVCHGSIRGLCNGQDVVNLAKGIVTYVYHVEKNTQKYGQRGLQFALIECGHAAQNLILAASSLGLGSRCIGAVDFNLAAIAFGLSFAHVPLYAVALY